MPALVQRSAIAASMMASRTTGEKGICMTSTPTALLSFGFIASHVDLGSVKTGPPVMDAK